MAFLFKHLNLSGVIKGIRREEKLEIPAEALREALTNALCHRLLDSPSSSVGIAIYDDRVEIENTGHLPNELTVETIKQPHRSYPQNPIIASALYKTGFLESWGTGVSRIMEVCKAAGVSEPEYGTDGLFVWITFRRPVYDGGLDVGVNKDNINVDSPIDSPIDSPNSIRISDDTINKILEQIKLNPTITTDELSIVIEKSVRTIKKGIQILRKKGIIKRIDSPTIGGKWEIREDEEFSS